MSAMNLKECIKRLRYTISNKNKPNETDAIALNEVLKTLSGYQNKGVEENRVFAKVLCLYIKDKYYNSNQDINQTLKFLSMELKQPLEVHIEILASRMNSTQLTNYIKTLTIDVPESEFENVEALAKRENQFWEIHQKNILDEIMFYNSPEQVKGHFYTTANQILNTEIYRV